MPGGRPGFAAKAPYAPHAICARVAAGETLKAVCARPGMPSMTAVWRRRRADPAFDAALTAALRTGALARRHPFDEAAAAALLTRLEGGEPIKALLRDPALPGWRAYVTWRRSQVHFAEAVWRLTQRRRRLAQSLNHPRRRPFDPVAAERVLLALAKGGTLKRLRACDPTLPGARVLRRWRREQPAFAAELRTLTALGPHVRAVLRAKAQAAAVAERVAAGASLRGVGGEPGMPRPGTVRKWANRLGDFSETIRTAADARDDALADEILATAEGPGDPAEKRRRMARLYAQMNRGRTGAGRLPKEKPEWLRNGEED